MLMDRFYTALKRSGAVPFMRRMHFNTALLEVPSAGPAFRSLSALCPACVTGNPAEGSPPDARTRPDSTRLFGQ